MNAKNDVTKLACALQTTLSVVICACVMTGNCEEILYEKGEIEFDSNDKGDKEERTF